MVVSAEKGEKENKKCLLFGVRFLRSHDEFGSWQLFVLRKKRCEKI